jgi:hypothetical protein
MLRIIRLEASSLNSCYVAYFFCKIPKVKTPRISYQKVGPQLIEIPGGFAFAAH